MRQGRFSGRAGFSLVELLVVIGIIATLIALSGAGIFKWMESTRVNNTIAVIKEVDSALQKRWSKVIADARSTKETPSPAIYTIAGNDPARARVLWIKVRLLEAFPLSYAEITNNPLYQNIAALGGPIIPPGQRKYIASYQRMLGSATSGNAQAQMSACLLMALSVDQEGKVDLSPYTGDTDGDGIRELVDNWGNPLAFYRFPWGNTELDNSKPGATSTKAANFRDNLDPDGELMKSTWNNWTSYSNGIGPALAEAYCHSVHTGSGPTYQPKSFYMIPTVVSAGSDGQLGLTPGSMAVSTLAQAKDNIYSFKLKLGGGAQ